MSAKPLPFISLDEQQTITALCARCALILMQYGAESAVVVDLTQRLGRALGASDVACAVAFNAITLSTIYNGRAITITNNTQHQAVNVAALMQVQQIVMYAERRRRSAVRIMRRFDALNLQKLHYSPSTISLGIGLSCAAFAYLNGASMAASMLSMLGASVAMLLRTAMARAHFNPFVIAILSAFLASVVSGFGHIYGLEGSDIAMAAAILLLVPSFPIINALSDVLKGYINMGVGRWVHASMLTISACVGIVIAISILGINHWGI